MTTPKTRVADPVAAMTYEQEFARVDNELMILRNTTTEIKTDVAAMPGRIVAMLDQRQKVPQDDTWKWAFGVILTMIGGGFLLLWQADGNVRSEVGKQSDSLATLLHEHTVDKHPTRVEATVQELKAEVKAASTFAEHEYVRRHEYERQQAADKLALAARMAVSDLATAVKVAKLEAKQEMLKEGMVKSMELGGASGRAAAENRGRVDEALRALERQLDQRNFDRD